LTIEEFENIDYHSILLRQLYSNARTIFNEDYVDYKLTGKENAYKTQNLRSEVKEVERY
jgi:hypothetical protein